jgi:hypothetical protein
MRNKTLPQYAGVYSVIRLWITLTGRPQCSPTGCINIFHTSTVLNIMSRDAFVVHVIDVLFVASRLHYTNPFFVASM